jgi:hypothetical protein
MSFTAFSYRLEALLSLPPSDGGTHRSILLVQPQQIALIVKEPVLRNGPAKAIDSQPSQAAQEAERILDWSMTEGLLLTETTSPALTL